MATPKQKQALVEALKFTPREIEISLSGYGGEIVLGRVSEEVYDFWEGRDDLADYATSWDGEMDEDVPADARFIDDGNWYDIDDLCHESGCEADASCNITVDDMLEGRTIWESSLDLDGLAAQGVDTSSYSHVRPNETEPAGTYVFLGQNFEKGCFFNGRLRITRPFDPRLLTIHWTDCDGWRIIGGIDYDGEEVDGSGGYSTTGKSMEFNVYRVERDDWDPRAELEKIEVPVLEGEEMWAQEAIDSEPETWEGIPVTPWWSAEDKPTRRGEYEVLHANSNWPFPQRARWTGTRWLQDGVMIPVTQWRGLTQPAD